MKRVLRDSNYELLRIIATFFVVLWHAIIHANLLNKTSGTVNFVLVALIFITIIHVSLYMLITGYYQCNGNFKLSKLLSLIGEVWFYNIIINSILMITGVVKYTNIEFLKQTFIFNYECYWYIGCYIVTYLLSPYLNKLIHNCSRADLKKIIIINIGCFSILPYLTGNISFLISGFNLYQFLMMYFIGAYIRKYNLNEEFLSRMNVYQKRFVYLSVYILLLLLNFSLFYLKDTLRLLDSNILKHIANNIEMYFYEYNSPFVVFESIFIFMFFGTFQIKCRFINLISSTTVGIYLIHESCYMQKIIYNLLDLTNKNYMSSNLFIPRLLITVLIIFVVCSVLELLRKVLSKLIFKIKPINYIWKSLNEKISKLLEVNY